MKRYIKATVHSISDEEYDVQKELALFPDSTPEMLDTLADSIYPSIRELVAKNKNTSVSTLLKLCKDNEQVIKVAIARRPFKEEEIPVYEALLYDPLSSIRLSILWNYTLPDEVLIPLMDDEDPEVRKVLASVLSESSLLDRLAHDEDADIRFAVAENPATDSGTLHFLANDEDRYVKSAVAANGNTDNSDLKSLATDINPNVRYSVAKNLKTPKDILAILSNDTFGVVREKANHRLHITQELI